MALTAVQIASQALVRLGALPISDFAEPTLEARTAAALYPTLRDTLLAGHAWRFATAEAELEPAEEAPLDGFAHAFRLPAGFLNALAVGEGRETGWRIAGGRLHAAALRRARRTDALQDPARAPLRFPLIEARA